MPEPYERSVVTARPTGRTPLRAEVSGSTPLLSIMDNHAHAPAARAAAGTWDVTTRAKFEAMSIWTLVAPSGIAVLPRNPMAQCGSAAEHL